MSISSCSMGSVNVRAWVDGLEGDKGPSWTGVLKLHHISSLLHTISSPLTSIPIQSPKCAIFSTAPLPPVTFSFNLSIKSTAVVGSSPFDDGVLDGEEERRGAGHRFLRLGAEEGDLDLDVGRVLLDWRVV